jgi:hypothetical protein
MERRELALRGEAAQQRGRGRRERNEEAAAEVEGEEAESSATFAAIALARESWDGWLCGWANVLPMGLAVAICHLGSSYWAGPIFSIITE